MVSQSQENRSESAQNFDLQGTIRGLFLPIVEFLGILVPGVIFNVSFVFALMLPLMSIMELYSGAKHTESPLITNSMLSLMSPGMGTIILVSVFSYVVGHLFFRQDPKLPDLKSFEIVRETIGEEGPVRLWKNERQYNNDNNIENKHNLEFPYRYLKEYLSDRGMDHLAKMIPWSGDDPSSYKRRTKHFINTIKVRIEFMFPFQYLRIQRNEAHVRLMSSMWYASSSICFTAALGIALGGIILVEYVVINGSELPYPYLPSLFVPGVIFIISVYMKNNIESFLHYQRIREIVFILETAYLSNKLNSEFELSKLCEQKDKNA
jgi:hypothetical protein